MIELKGVSKTLSGERIFENISFRVGNGECVAVICEGEEQKILMSSILSGSVGVSEGSVLVGGYDLSKHKLKASRQIGVVPAEGALYESMTVGEFLTFVAEAKEIVYERINAKMRDAITFCALETYKDHLISALSHSVRRRVLLAQAILTEVSVLIVCESAAELDTQSKKIFENAVFAAASGGASVVLLCSEDSFLRGLASAAYKIDGTGLCPIEASEEEGEKE